MAKPTTFTNKLTGGKETLEDIFNKQKKAIKKEIRRKTKI